MHRNTFVVLVTLAMFAALGCGSANDTGSASSSSATSGSTAGTPPVSAPAPEAAANLLPSVVGCLNLVKAERYAEAISPCTQALQDAPDNADVTAALARARNGVAATAAGAEAAAADAAAQAQTGAEDKAAAQAQGMLNKALGGTGKGAGN